ncbi:B3 domain-containing protein At3g18960-like isoform X1 [Vigna angularis]|uniref:B3 domain-containing protein At3g18960-like isoform X1 n=1 Tax=Phaseolus angularis TaxID=3914 RepID=UPI000809C04A|nr:B3 domain-containing protein At3g18960-like isoform X1 [Vigna angularis]
MENCTQRNATLTISFFKVILKTNLQSIKIPNIFTANYGGGLPNPLFMKLPNGTEWKVIWEKDSGEIWLREGWKEFVEHYSLDHGHFVFFKYEGTSEVHVNICDQSGVEIDYLCGTGDGNYNLDQNEEEPIIILDEEEDPEQIRGCELHSTGETSVQRTSSLNRPSQTRAREVACNFVSCNPFFTVFIKPSHGKDYRLRIPDLKGIIEEKKKCAVLQLGEISWKVNLLFNNSCFAHHSFGAGIHLFLTESEVQPGDVCVFELISKEDCVFKVHIFKSDQ